MLDAIAVHRLVPDKKAEDLPLSLVQRMRLQAQTKAGHAVEPRVKLRRKPRLEEPVPPSVLPPVLPAEVFLGQEVMPRHRSVSALRQQLPSSEAPLVLSAPSMGGESAVRSFQPGATLPLAPAAATQQQESMAQAQVVPVASAQVVLAQVVPVPVAPTQVVLAQLAPAPVAAQAQQVAQAKLTPLSPMQSETETHRHIYTPVLPISLSPPAVFAFDPPNTVVAQRSRSTAPLTVLPEGAQHGSGLTYQFKSWGAGHAVHVERTVSAAGEIGFVLNPSSFEVAQHLRDHPLMPADTYLKHDMGDGAGQHGQGAQDEVPQDEDA
jgi:hypothetical protein